MIINLRGTGGAGKSHLVRRIMELYDKRDAKFIEGRKRPIGYVCSRSKVDMETVGPPLYVPGHYETPTGGCDTIQLIDDVYAFVNLAAKNGHDVLFEGIMIGDDVRRCVELHRDYKVMVIALNTPLEECLKGIQQRRDARGDDKPLNPKNTISRADRLKRSMMPRLKDAGVDTRWLSREEAFETVKKALAL